MNIIWLFSFLTDSVIALLYFRQDANTFSKQKLWLKLILLLLLLPLYPNAIIIVVPYSIIRVTLRAIIYVTYLRYTEGASLQISVYGALFWTTVYVVFQNVFFGPHLNAIFMGKVAIVPSPFWSQVLLSCITVISRLIYFGIIAAFFRFSDMREAKLRHMSFATIVCIISIYTQSTGMKLQSAFNELPNQFSVYYILLHVVLLLFLLVFEYSRRRSVEYAAMVRQNTASEALLENIRNLQQSEKSIRSLRHDLKNHAIALRLLLEQGDTERAIKYLETFQSEAEVPNGTFRTGNDLLNGLLKQKLSSALEQGINVEVSLDFRQGEFIEPFDLCVLMGNILDNAVEACLKIDSESDRFIRVSGGLSANCLLIKAENSCVNNSVSTDSLPHTTKANTLIHGYGLRNIQRVLDRYNGNLTIKTEEANRFTATMLIPIP